MLPLPRWGTVRLRMTLWNVAVLALILGSLGGVVRYRVQADLFAAVDQILTQRVTKVVRDLQSTEPTIGPSVFGDRGPAPGPPPRGDTLPPPGEPKIALVSPPVGVPSAKARARVGDRLEFPASFELRVIYREPAIDVGREPLDRHSLARSFAGEEVYSTVPGRGGTPLRVLSVPVERRGRVERVLQLAYPLSGVLQELDRQSRGLLALVPLGLLAAGLGGAFLTGRALRPVGEIAAAAERLGGHDLSGRLPVSGHDEFTELAASFNALLARLEEAFDRQRRFTADASHELRTPLSIIKANTNLALEHPWPAERYHEFLTAIDTAAGRQSRIVEELLFLARADAGGLARDVGPVCLLEVLEEAAEAVAGPGQAFVRIEGVDPALLIPGSGSELTRLFTNLLQNAVRHTPPPGAVTVAAATDAQSVVVTVTDTGEGIPPEHLPHLGERFYRVDAARAADKGSVGLGLAICRSIVQAHSGTITIESKVGKGTVVRIRLPLLPPRP